MRTTLTRRELNLAIFEGNADAVLWQPRMETWWGYHQEKGTLPDNYRGLGHVDFYNALGASVRYVPVFGCEEWYDQDLVQRQEVREKNDVRVSWTTRSGTITTHYHDAIDSMGIWHRRITRYPVADARDLRVASEVVAAQRLKVDPAACQKGTFDAVGSAGEPNLMFRGAGFTDLIKEWCGLENTFYLMADEPAAIDAYLEACDDRDDRMIAEILKLPFKIINLGDHATDEFTPPGVIEKYMMPRWQKIADKLHAHGRFVHSHWDGNAKTILPYLKDTGLDGVEALTPEPQGNITLEAIKAAVGDRMVVLDLIPAILFMEQYTMEQVLDYTRRVMDLFAPRLILGISDEISEVGQIEKVETITQLVDTLCGLAR